ncbi:hypothetical protein Tco_0222555 [Tanacetum coccineum]
MFERIICRGRRVEEFIQKKLVDLKENHNTAKDNELKIRMLGEYVGMVSYIMADLNIPTNDAPVEQAHVVAPPTRTDDQILPLSKWVPISKRNSVLDVHKPQRNLIFPMFWDTMCFNSSTGLYSCQLDEKWFNLHKDILRGALNITLANDNNPFVAPPSSDAVIEYVNTLGYLSTLRNVKLLDMIDQDILYYRYLGEESSYCFAWKEKDRFSAYPKHQIHHDNHPSPENQHNIHPRLVWPLHYSQKWIWKTSSLTPSGLWEKDGREIISDAIPDAHSLINKSTYTAIIKSKSPGKAEGRKEQTELLKLTKVTNPKQLSHKTCL